MSSEHRAPLLALQQGQWEAGGKSQGAAPGAPPAFSPQDPLPAALAQAGWAAPSPKCSWLRLGLEEEQQSEISTPLDDTVLVSLSNMCRISNLRNPKVCRISSLKNMLTT